MKLTKWMFGAMALTLMAACSDKDSPEYQGEANLPEEITKGYLALQINLPQESSTRAGDEDNKGGNMDNVEFNDGESWEYAVNKAEVLIFKTSSDTSLEDDATFVTKETLTRKFITTDDDPYNQISASSIEAAEVSINTSSNPILWAMVVLNPPANFVYPTSPSTDDNGDPVAGQTFGSYVTAATISNDFGNTPSYINPNADENDKIKVAISDNFITTASDKKYIYMTNALMSKKQGGAISQKPHADGATTPVFSLVKLGRANAVIKGSIEDARSNPAACIYVERAVAKITAVRNDNMTLKYGDGEDDQLKVTKVSMGLRNINNISYSVRNCKNVTSQFNWNLTNTTSPAYYRMIGHQGMPVLYAPLHENPVPYDVFRTYWCSDPHYGAIMPNTVKSEHADGQLKEITTTASSANAFYVKENTFSVSNMNNGNTTLALFKVQFGVGDENPDLYILNEDQKTIYKNSDAVESYPIEYVTHQQSVKEAFKYAAKSGANVENLNVTALLDVQFALDEATGKWEATSITMGPITGFEDYFDNNSKSKFNEKLAQLEGENAQNLIDRINDNFRIKKYTNGISYYQIPIMHFGEKSTPWTATNNKNQTETSVTYGTGQDAVDAYLGRYGLVRNNWYELKVTSFTGLGDPVRPEIDITLSDDKNVIKQYIGIETHILSWAKRSQEVTF